MPGEAPDIRRADAVIAKRMRLAYPAAFARFSNRNHMHATVARLFAAALALSTFAHAAPAPAPAPKPVSQEQRIEQGEKDGSLTAKEARKLREEQDKIHALERKAASRGGPTAREQRKLDKLRDKADQDITRYKHNDRGADSRTH